MTSLLIFIGIIVLVALLVRHHDKRSGRAPQPWTDAVIDRDTQRMRDEIHHLAA